MKKVIALSIGLAFSVGAIAQEQVQSVSTMEKTQSIVKEIVNFAKNNNTNTPINSNSVEVKPATELKEEPKKEIENVEKPKNEIKEDIVKLETKKDETKNVAVNSQIESAKPVKKAKVSKKKVKKPAKIAPKPIDEKNVLPTEPKAVLLQAEHYYIPKQAKMEQFALFAKPITYDDVELIISSKDENINVSLIDKRINKPLDNFYLYNQKFNIFNLSTDLSKKEALEVNYNESSTQQVSFKNQGICRAIFIEYKLNNQNSAKSEVKFVDGYGNLVNTMPSSCNENIPDSKDTTFYTDNGTIINVGSAQIQSAEKGLSVQVHFTKEGHEFNPANLKAYAVAQNFSKSYTLNSKINSSGSFLGVNLSQKVSPGAYYILIGHETGQKFEWVKANINIQ